MIEFTDAELGFIQLVLAKCDPTGLIGEAETIRKKIQEYAQAKQQGQMAQAASTEPAENG